MTTEPIRNKEELSALANNFHERGEHRNHVLVVLGVHTALRISDLLKLRWEDVYDSNREDFRSHLALAEQKTGKKKSIALNEQAVEALREYWPHHKGEYIFVSRSGDGPITRVQAYRIIRNACTALGSRAKSPVTRSGKLGDTTPGLARRYPRC